MPSWTKYVWSRVLTTAVVLLWHTTTTRRLPGVSSLLRKARRGSRSHSRVNSRAKLLDSRCLLRGSCQPGARSVRPPRQFRGTLGRLHARVGGLALPERQSRQGGDGTRSKTQLATAAARGMQRKEAPRTHRLLQQCSKQSLSFRRSRMMPPRMCDARCAHATVRVNSSHFRRLLVGVFGVIRNNG